MQVLDLNVMTIQVTLSQFSELYVILFVLGIVTLTFTIILRSLLLFIGQFALLAMWMMFSSLMISFIFITIQLVLILYLLYRMKKAIDYNYTLVLEKTHLAPKYITEGGSTGTRLTF